MNTETIIFIAAIVALVALLGAGIASEYLSKERIVRCQIENKARPATEVALLCSVLR